MMMESSIVKYLQLFYKSVRFPIQVVNREGNIIYVNELFTIQWGHNLSELKEYNVFEDNELTRKGVQQLIKEALIDNKESMVDNFVDTLLLSREVAVPLLRTSIFPVTFEDQRYAVLMHEDQTEQFLAEEEIKKARDAGNEAERLKNTFLTVLSHELRTPLNIILGYSTIIKENLAEKFSAEEKIYLDNLYSGSSRLFKSITQMLEFAQIEAGNYNMDINCHDFCEIVQNSIEANRESAAAKKLDITTKFEIQKIYVDVDIQCTETAISNLLENAIKFTGQGYVDIEVNIMADRGLATCKIKDTGIGISSQYLDHLYQPFSQEDLNIERNYEGNGLGLALSKRYIEKMGGSILIDSIKGVGTTLTITLPLSKKQTRESPESLPKVVTEHNKILMFDDTGESYELVKVFLRDAYEFELQKFKEFDLELVNNEVYSMIIIDVPKNLWDDCVQLVKQIKESDPYKRPVLVLSSEFMHEKISQFHQAGVDKFLVKPFAKNDLMTAIEKITVS
jgi:signal transduction histidine kinase